MSDFADAVKKAQIKSNFNDKVKAERGDGSLAEKPVQFVLKNPTVIYRIEEDGYTQEAWPSTFKWNPTVGDMVESQSGSTLKINSITHKVGGVVQITLGRDTGGSTGIEGAGIGPISVESE